MQVVTDPADESSACQLQGVVPDCCESWPQYLYLPLNWTQRATQRCPRCPSPGGCRRCPSPTSNPPKFSIPPQNFGGRTLGDARFTSPDSWNTLCFAAGCSYGAVERVNRDAMKPILEDLVRTPYMRYFKTDLYCECPLWPDDAMCSLRDCSVCECEPHEVPAPWRKAEEAAQQESCDSECTVLVVYLLLPEWRPHYGCGNSLQGTGAQGKTLHSYLMNHIPCRAAGAANKTAMVFALAPCRGLSPLIPCCLAHRFATRIRR